MPLCTSCGQDAPARIGRRRECRACYLAPPRLQQLLLARRAIDAAGCWLWTGPVAGDGRAFINLAWAPGRARKFPVHVVAAWAWLGRSLRKRGPVAHTCAAAGRCFNPAHLRPFANPRGLAVWTARQGRRARGSANGRAKLTEADVAQVRAHLDAGQLTEDEIARLLPVKLSARAIRDIATGRTWAPRKEAA